MIPSSRVENCYDELIAALHVHALPILWLYFWNPLFELGWDGVFFWGIYAVLTILHSIVIWFSYRSRPIESQGETSEVSNAFYALICASFPLIIYFSIAWIYHALK